MIRDMAAPKITLRPAELCDAAAIAAIYAPIVRDTFISFETEPPSVRSSPSASKPQNGDTHGWSQRWARR
jgi:L-amino acid N-acyltransferase YncA